MKLTEQQRKVLRAVQLQAKSTVAEISRAAGLKQHSVRSSLQLLIDRGIIRSSVFVNLAPLGFSRYNLFLSYLTKGKKTKAKLIEELTNDSSVIFVAEVGGDWNLEVSFAARGTGELAIFLETLSQRFEGGLLDKSLVVTLEKHLFGSKYLWPSLQVPPLSLLPRLSKVALTEVDHKILVELANTPGISLQLIGRKLGLPVSTVAYRVQRLESTKVIEGWYYVQNAFGYEMLRFKILIFTRGMSRKLSMRVYDFCRLHKNVDLLMVCAGTHDFELVVQAENYDQVMALLEDIREQFQEDVSHVRVFPTFKVHKFSDYPFKHFEQLNPPPGTE